MLYKVGGFVSGMAISSAFVCSMNDVIYSQLRRNIIKPTKKIVEGISSSDNNSSLFNKDSLEGVKDLGQGASNFLY